MVIPVKNIYLNTFGKIQDKLFSGFGPSSFPGLVGTREKAICLKTADYAIQYDLSEYQEYTIKNLLKIATPIHSTLGSPHDQAFRQPSPPPGPGGTYAETKNKLQAEQDKYDQNLQTNYESTVNLLFENPPIQEYVDFIIGQIQTYFWSVKERHYPCYASVDGEDVKYSFSYFDDYTKFKCSPGGLTSEDPTNIEDDSDKIEDRRSIDNKQFGDNIAIPIFRTLVNGVFLTSYGPSRSLYSLGHKTHNNSIIIRKIYLENKLVYANGTCLTSDIDSVTIVPPDSKIYSHLHTVLLHQTTPGGLAFEIEEVQPDIENNIFTITSVNGKIQYGSLNYLIYKSPTNEYFNAYDSKLQPISFPDPSNPSYSGVALPHDIVWPNSIYNPTKQSLDHINLFVNTKCGQHNHNLITEEYFYDTLTQDLKYTPLSQAILHPKHDIIGKYIITPKYLILRRGLINSFKHTSYFEYDRVFANESGKHIILLKQTPGKTRIKILLLYDFLRFSPESERYITLPYELILPHPSSIYMISNYLWMIIRKDTGEILGLDVRAGEITSLGIKIPNPSLYQYINYFKPHTDTFDIDKWTFIGIKSETEFDKLTLNTTATLSNRRIIETALTRLLGNKVRFEGLSGSKPLLGASLIINKPVVQHAERIARTLGLSVFNDSGRMRITDQDIGIINNPYLQTLIQNFAAQINEPAISSSRTSGTELENNNPIITFRYLDANDGVYRVLQYELPPEFNSQEIESGVTLTFNDAKKSAAFYRDLIVSYKSISSKSGNMKTSLPLGHTLKNFPVGKTIAWDSSLTLSTYTSDISSINQTYPTPPDDIYADLSTYYANTYPSFPLRTRYGNLAQISFPPLIGNFSGRNLRFPKALILKNPNRLAHGTLQSNLRCYLTSSSRHIGYSYKDTLLVTIFDDVLDAAEITLSSTTYETLLTNPYTNLLCVNHREWIQYTYVEQISSNTFKLSGLLRGRFGTLYNITNKDQLAAGAPVVFYRPDLFTYTYKIPFYKRPAKIFIYDGLKIASQEQIRNYDIEFLQLLRIQWLRMSGYIHTVQDFYEETFYTGEIYTALEVRPAIKTLIKKIPTTELIDLSDPSHSFYPDITELHNTFFLSRGTIKSTNPIIYTLSTNKYKLIHHVAYTLGPENQTAIQRGNRKLSVISTNDLNGKFIQHFNTNV